MTFYFAEGEFAVVSFEVDPSVDATAPAKIWTPYDPNWVGAGKLAYDVIWSGDYYPIPEDVVPVMQQRCRDLYAMRKASGTP